MKWGQKKQMLGKPPRAIPSSLLDFGSASCACPTEEGIHMVAVEGQPDCFQHDKTMK